MKSHFVFNPSTTILIILFLWSANLVFGQTRVWTISGELESTTVNGRVSAAFSETRAISESDSSTYFEFTGQDSNGDPVYYWGMVFGGENRSLSLGARSIENSNQDPFACDIFPVSFFEPLELIDGTITANGQEGYSDNIEKCGGLLTVSINYTITVQSITPVGEISEVSGDATVLRKGEDQALPLQLGDFVLESDVLSTGQDGTLTILFIDETSITIGDNSELTIQEYLYDSGSEGGRAEYGLIGRILLYVGGLLDHGGDTKIETPAGGFGIRGTELSLAYLESNGIASLELSVISGRVEFKSKSSAKVVLIDAGETFSLEELILPADTVILKVISQKPMTFVIFGNPKEDVIIQKSTDLRQWNPWLTVPAHDLPLQLTDPDASEMPSAFYRAILP